MENNLFITLDENMLLECDGGSPWSIFLKVIEAIGIVDAVSDFGSGFVAGFKDGYNK